MNNAERHLWLSYGPKALVAEFGPHGAAIVCGVVAPAGAPAFKAPGMLATFAQGSSMPKPADQFKYAMPGPVEVAYNLIPAVMPQPKPQPKPLVPIATGVRVGAPMGYSRAEVDACIARMRAASPYATAAAILRTEPFAGALRLTAYIGPDGTRNTTSVIPWERMGLSPQDIEQDPRERALHAISVARHYAAAIQNGNARPLDTRAGFFGRLVENDRTVAWVNAWARWALDAVVIALNDPSTYPAVAGGILSICRGWDPTTVR